MKILQVGVLFQNGQDLLINLTGLDHNLFLDCIPNDHSRSETLYLLEFLKDKNVGCFIACRAVIRGTNSAGGAEKCSYLDWCDSKITIQTQKLAQFTKVLVESYR